MSVGVCYSEKGNGLALASGLIIKPKAQVFSAFGDKSSDAVAVQYAKFLNAVEDSGVSEQSHADCTDSVLIDFRRHLIFGQHNGERPVLLRHRDRPPRRKRWQGQFSRAGMNGHTKAQYCGGDKCNKAVHGMAPFIINSGRVAQ